MNPGSRGHVYKRSVPCSLCIKDFGPPIRWLDRKESNCLLVKEVVLPDFPLLGKNSPFYSQFHTLNPIFVDERKTWSYVLSPCPLVCEWIALARWNGFVIGFFSGLWFKIAHESFYHQEFWTFDRDAAATGLDRFPGLPYLFREIKKAGRDQHRDLLYQQ